MSAATIEEVEEALNGVARAHSGTCTWSLTDLTTGAHIAFDEDRVMPTASLIKVPVLVTLHQRAQEGNLSLDDRAVYREHHRSLGSGVLSKLSFGVEMTVRDAAVLMMIVSDNSATNMCIDLAGGPDAVNVQMRSVGLEKTTLFRRLGEPGAGMDARNHSVSTAGEIVRLMTLIARHEAVSPDASEDMLRIMRRCDYRHELSGLLPWNELNMLGDPAVSWVAEKGGAFLNGVRTSGAIFKGPNGHFVMSAFCEGGTGPGTGRESEGNRILALLGKTAWDALAA